MEGVEAALRPGLVDNIYHSGRHKVILYDGRQAIVFSRNKQNERK
jgi:hypothetical protein